MNKDKVEITIVRKAIVEGNAALLQDYLASGQDPSHVSLKGMSLLILSIWSGKSIETTRMLLEAGADISYRQDGTGWRALHYAAINDHLDALNLLHKHGDVFVTPHDWKAFHYAVQYRAYSTIPVLISMGADINMKDDDGITPLMRAAKAGVVEMVELLVNHNADVKAQDPNGHTALTYALNAGKKKVLSLL